ncbi:MAG: trypsin-like serine peptidase [Syntrophales bacterium]
MSASIGNKVTRTVVMAVFLVGIALGVALAGQEGQVYHVGNVTGYAPANQGIEGTGTIDYENAKPMPLPKALSAPQPLQGGAAAMSLGVPGFRPGFRGDGTLPPSTAMGNETETPGPPILQEYGTSEHPFTTSRVDLTTKNSESKLYPYKASGKLFFNIGLDTYVCSATLIEPGIIVTAAHCVCDFNAHTFYSNWQFIPAYYNGKHPYGIVYALEAWVMSSYLSGTDSCYQPGVICTNDVAVLVARPSGKLTPTNAKFPGYKIGWLGYGWDGYGFSSPSSGPGSGYSIALISQLGYPVSHDFGAMMQRTDSQGYVSTMSNNTVWGSRQTGGSSGGPEIVNLGAAPYLNGTGYGTDSDFNTVVGVTSWGYTDTAVKQQGASAFTSGNIVPLVNAGCTDWPLACF